GDPDGGAGSADCVRADANRTGPAVQRGYGVDAAVVRARRLQRRHRWPGTRVRPRAHEAPRLGAPPRATKWALIICLSIMKAIRIHNYGGPEDLKYEDAPRPTPQAGEVPILVHAAGGKPIDWPRPAGHIKVLWPH